MLYDCTVIGAGPAGLTAAIYLRRFRLNIKVLDNNASRASLIQKSHNYPAFPDGISGNDILQRMHQHLKKYEQ